MIARLSRVWEKTVTESDLSLPQYRLLAFLSDGEWAASALADWLSVSRPSITGLVDGLVERGFVERRESPTDRRRVMHQLTGTGRSHLAAASQRLGETLDELLAHLDDGEQRRVLDGLDLLSEAMRRHRDAVVSS